MKIIPLLASVYAMLMCLGCAKYQYATLTGDLEKNKDRHFVFENDSMRIKYSFNGRDCPIKIEVFNKLKTPIFVDWKKSALIIDENKFSYWIDESKLNAELEGYTIRWTKQLSTTDTKVNGTIFRNEQISFIPTQSSITLTPISIRSDFFHLPKATKEQKVILDKTTGMPGSKYSFQKDNTPLKFRSYLTISVTENFQNPIILDNEFWVSEIMQTRQDPAIFPNKSDQFYLDEGTYFGNIMIAIIGIALVFIFVITD